jgi:ABC-2 type transport system permease protein
VSATLDAALALVQRDALLFFSYRWRFVTQGLAILFTTVLFFYISRLVRVDPFPTPDAYFAYVVVGLVVLELLTAALATVPAMLRQELLTGTFERLAVSPLGTRSAVLAMTVFPVLLSLAVSLLTLLLAVVVFGLDLHWATAPLALPAIVLVAAAFAPLTVAVCALVLVAKQAGSAATFVVTGLSLASGAFFPVGLLPGWIRWVSDVQPLKPALELLRHLLTGTPVPDGPWLAVLKLALFGAVLLPASFAAFEAADRWCRRRGTLTEY